MNTKELLVPLLLTVVTIMGAFAAGQINADPPPPKGSQPNPFAGLTREEIDAFTQSARDKHKRWAQDFIAQGRDPRSLPKVTFGDTFATPPATLEAAVGASKVVVVGRVVRTDFAFISADSDMPLATVTVNVERTMKGQPQEKVVFRLPGGPDFNGGEPVLVQFPGGEIPLVGDEAVMMLKSDWLDGKTYTAVPWAGVLFLTPKGVVPEEGNAFAAEVAGKSKAEIIAAIETAVAVAP